MTEKDSMQNILKYCPDCGIPLNWSKDLRYCTNCGFYLIPYIPKSLIRKWLDEDLSDDEIKKLYSPNIIAHKLGNESILDRYRIMPRNRMRRDWGWKASLGIPILSYFGKLIAVVAISVIFLFFVGNNGNISDVNSLSSRNIIILGIIDLSTQPIFILIPYWIIGYYFPKGTPSREKWNALGIPIGKITKKKALKDILIGTGFAIIMVIVVFAVEYGSGHLVSYIYNIPITELQSQDTTGTTISGFPNTIEFLIILTLFMFFSIGPSEEILFRGFAQKGFTRSWGKKAGWIVTAIFFAIFHIYAYIRYPPLFLYTFLPYLALALIIGALYMWRKNVISTIFAHATYNSLLFLIYFLFASSIIIH